MKKILVPTDFSETAEYAVEFAGNLARKSGAEIFMLHVIDVAGIDEIDEEGRWASDETGGSGWVPFKMALMRKTKERMENTIEKYLKDVKVEHNIKMGPITDRIVDAIEDYGADMVVMGTHGASGANEYFIGSNAEKVVRNAKLPVLTIRQRMMVDNINKILFASDFSEEAYQVFPEVEKFANIFGANLHLVKVSTPGLFSGSRESRDEYRSFLNKLGAREYPFTLYNSNSKEEGIIEYADEINADLIALGTHGRGGLSQMFNRSIAEGLVNHSFKPVLTINISK